MYSREFPRQGQESIPVGCVPATWKPYPFQFHWPPPDITPGGPRSHVRGEGADVGGGLYSEIECIMGNGYMGPPSPPDRMMTDRHD